MVLEPATYNLVVAEKEIEQAIYQLGDLFIE